LCDGLAAPLFSQKVAIEFSVTLAYPIKTELFVRELGTVAIESAGELGPRRYY